jgi:hypothetical protein
MHSKCLDFIFFLTFWWVEGGGGSSHQVPNMFHSFSMRSPRVFPIAPHFKPICFAQSPPLLTYVVGSNGQALYLSLDSLILGFFCNGPTKLAHCKEKKSWIRINAGTLAPRVYKLASQFQWYLISALGSIQGHKSSAFMSNLGHRLKRLFLFQP